MHIRTRLSRSGIVIAVLVAAALACTLQIGGNNQRPAVSAIPTVDRPTVEIIQPADGARFSKGQTVTVSARATSASGVTLVELLANGIRVASQPPAELNQTVVDVVLDYKAEQVGTIVLAVRAYSNAIVGQPAQRTITVLEEFSPGPGGAGTPQTYFPPTATPYNPQCRARVNAGGLRMRSGPGTNYDIIGNFEVGQEPPIVGYAQLPDGQWWQVSWGGQIGWTSAAYTTQLGDCSAIRPAVIPASPTPIASATPQPTVPGVTSTPTLPDLRLSMLEGVSSVQLGANGTAQAIYIIRVVNSGGQASGQFRMAVLKPDGQVDYYDVPSLSPGQELQVPSNGLTVTFTTPGVTRILVTVDDQNVVAESNESNNQAYKDITVNPGPPTITPPPTATQPAPPTATQPPPPTETPPETTNSGNNGQPQVPPLSPITAANAAYVDKIAELTGHGGTITGLDFSPDGLTLASSSRDGTIRLWDVYGEAERLILAGHTDRVLDVAFSPDGSRVASASWDGTIRLWDTTTGVEIMSLNHGAPASYVAFSPDGSRLASGGDNPDAAGGLSGLAKVWDAYSGGQLASIQVFGPVSGVAFLNANTLVVATQGKDCSLGGGAVELYDVGSGGLALTFSGSSAWINALGVAPNSGLIAGSGQTGLCSGNGIVWLWYSNGALQATFDHGGDTGVVALAFDPFGGLLASASTSGSVRLWDMSTGGQVAVLTNGSEADSVAFSPNGVLVASGGADSTIRLWGTP
jgi:WD40 repeat protein